MPKEGDSDSDSEQPDPKLCMTRHANLQDFALTSNPNNPIN